MAEKYINPKDNESFLTSMQKRIRMLGFAAIIALLFVGYSGFMTLFRSGVNNKVLTELNYISTAQYEININIEESFKDPSCSTQVLNSFKKMKESAKVASDLVYSAETKNDINDITINSNNNYINIDSNINGMLTVNTKTSTLKVKEVILLHP